MNNRYLFFFALIAFILATGILAQLGLDKAAVATGVAGVVTLGGLFAEIERMFS